MPHTMTTTPTPTPRTDKCCNAFKKIASNMTIDEDVALCDLMNESANMERELAAAQATIRELEAVIDFKSKVKCDAIVNKEELEADKERLDWLESHERFELVLLPDEVKCHEIHTFDENNNCNGCYEGVTLRTAIDEARKK